MIAVPVELAPIVAVLIVACYLCQLINAREEQKNAEKAKVTTLQGQLRYAALDTERRLARSQSLELREPDFAVCPDCHSQIKLTGSIVKPDGSIHCTSCFKRFKPEHFI